MRSLPTETRSDGTHEADFFKGRAGYDPAFLGDGDLLAPWPGLTQGSRRSSRRPATPRRRAPRAPLHALRRQVPRRPPPAPDDGGQHRRSHVGADQARGRQVVLRPPDPGVAAAHPGRLRRPGDRPWPPGEARRPNWGATWWPLPTAARRASRRSGQRRHVPLRQRRSADLEAEPGQDCGRAWRTTCSTTPGSRASGSRSSPARCSAPTTPRSSRAPRTAQVLEGGGDDRRGDRPPARHGVPAQPGRANRDLLERRSRNEAVEGFTLGEYRTFQIAVRDLAEATGYDLSTYAAADPLGATADNEGIEDGVPVFVPLDRPRAGHHLTRTSAPHHHGYVTATSIEGEVT